MATKREVQEWVFREVGLAAWEWPEEARNRLSHVNPIVPAEHEAKQIIKILRRENLAP